MNRGDVFWLALPVLLLCVTAAFGLWVAADLHARAGADSLVALIDGALNDPSKLTPDHVHSVLGAAKTIEAIGVRAEIETANTVAAMARGCFGIALVEVLLIGSVVSRIRRRGTL